MNTSFNDLAAVLRSLESSLEQAGGLDQFSLHVSLVPFNTDPVDDRPATQEELAGAIALLSENLYELNQINLDSLGALVLDRHFDLTDVQPLVNELAAEDIRTVMIFEDILHWMSDPLPEFHKHSHVNLTIRAQLCLDTLTLYMTTEATALERQRSSNGNGASDFEYTGTWREVLNREVRLVKDEIEAVEKAAIYAQKMRFEFLPELE